MTVNQKAAVANKIHNFYAGPAILPREVLEQAQAELLDYQSSGMSILEMSHRSTAYEDVNTEAQSRLKGLLGLNEDYDVLFLQGGASLQFAMLPMNFLPPDGVADYILTGSWSEKAFAEASTIGGTHVAASTKDSKFDHIPRQEDIQLSSSPAYVHMTSNNTIYGTQWHYLPEIGDARLVVDMSSDILSRPIEASKFSLIYAGAQKNLGPAGLTIVALRSEWLDEADTGIPAILQYRTHASRQSLYNTPPVFAVYMTNLTLKWLQDNGGVEHMDERNRQKAKLIYDAIDSSDGFYRGHAEPGSRSLMNITFRLAKESLEKQFISEAGKEGFVGLAGHRSVGGIRVSIYNAMGVESCQALASFMARFAQSKG